MQFPTSEQGQYTREPSLSSTLAKWTQKADLHCLR